jgi:hypothetical protein
VESAEGTPEITDFSINNTGTSTLTITGSSNSIELSPAVETLTFTGTGDIVLDTTTSVAEGDSGISGPGLSTLDATGLSGDLTLGTVEDVDDDDFSFTSGTGVTTMTMAYDDLAAGATINDTGWSFDFTAADVGSKLTLGPGLTTAAGSDLSIDMGANGTLCIDQSLNLTDVNASITSANAIVLADGAELFLTAAQADGLTIVGENGAASTGVVHIVGLGDTPVDLSGISADVAGYVFLEDDDVSLDPATDLGNMTVGLIANSAADLNPAGGQTLRLAVEGQADGLMVDVIKSIAIDETDPAAPTADLVDWDDASGGSTDDSNLTNSTNIAWLFDSVAGPLDTSMYDPSLGRLWFSNDLLNSVGGAAEQLFNTLPDTILRVDFNTVVELDILLASAAVDRVVELTSFTDIVGLTEVDDGISPEEHIESLTVEFGGEVTSGDFVIGDVVAAPDTDPLTPEFTTLTLNSRVALDDDHFLATEDYVNDNDGIDEVGETVQPMMVNTIGDIVVGGTNPGIDLMDVVINTFADASGAVGIGDQTFTSDPLNFATNDGADFVFGTLVFDSETAGNADLTITGENDVTGKAIDSSDAEVTSVTIDLTNHSGTFTLTGGSPAFDADDVDDTTTTLTILNDSTADGVVQFASTITFDDGGTPENEANVEYNVGAGNTIPFSGVSGGALELIDTSDHAGTISLGVISQVNSETFAITAGTTGQLFAHIGEGIDGTTDGDAETPMLGATGTWTFTGEGGGNLDFGGANNFDLEISAIDVDAGGSLVFNDVDVCITGDVDLSEAVLAFNGSTTLKIAAGAKLTLTIEQATLLDDAGFNIFGEGTVCITGESDDNGGSGANTDFDNIRVGTLDLSAVTLAAADSDQMLNITANGAQDTSGAALVVDGDRIAQTIIGSANDDELTVAGASDSDASTIDVIARLGADNGDIGEPNATPSGNTPTDATPEVPGDTIITAGSGANIQVEVDAGFDQIDFIATGDVYQVAAGAEFYGTLSPADSPFVATSDTTNDGTAVLEATGDGTIDVSAAGGANGWSLIGGPDGSVNTLIGSDQDDNNTLVDGSALDADNTGEADTFTGNAGADRFLFNVATSDPADFSAETTIREARDYEAMVIGYTDAGDEATDQITINLDLDGDNIDVLVNESLTPGVDFTSAASIASAIVTRLNDTPGITAVLDPADAGGTTVAAYGENGQLLAFNSFTPTGPGMTGAGVDQFGGSVTNEIRDDALGHGDDGTDTLDDDIGEVSMTLTGPVTVGETYSMTITVGDGDSYTRSVTAATTDPQDVLNSLATQFNAIIGVEFDAYTDVVVPGAAGPIAPTGGAVAVAPGEIRIVDQLAQDGGSNITATTATSAVTAVSSSSILDGTHTSAADAAADVITDFTTGEDSIDFDILGAGTALNYTSGAEAASFMAAETAANSGANLGGGNTYYMTSTAADGGLLFYDANGDGEADGVVNLTGVDASTFAFSDIV